MYVVIITINQEKFDNYKNIYNMYYTIRIKPFVLQGCITTYGYMAIMEGKISKSVFPYMAILYDHNIW